MLGGLLSLVSAVTFAYANAAVRRGVLTGTATQAVAVSLIVALPFFAAALALTGGFALVGAFSWKSLILLALAGIIHFGWARHCNYRATKAMGANLVAPVQQYSLVLTLFLAFVWLGEVLTALRIAGIVLVVLGPALMLDGDGDRPSSNGAAAQPERYKPDLAEGYLYALLSAVGFGISPILIAEALQDKSIAIGLAAVFVSYVAAAVAVVLPLLRPAEWKQLRALDGVSAKWFLISGISVAVSQMTRYMALAIAPVSVVTPINRLSLVFRLYFGARLNPDHEVFGERVLWGTVISLLGALALSASVNDVIDVIPMPDAISAILRWELRLPRW